MDTGAEGGNMVFVKVRETYDLHTVKNKMTVIAIHTPKPDILKRNYPGLLMQCRAYRPVSADVRVACASLQSLDPLQIGTESTDIAPEDVFNPILYKAMSNKGMSQLEALIQNTANGGASVDVDGQTAAVDADSVTTAVDEFNIYYGLLANTHDWRHASPQAGLSMSGLKPLVYEMVYNVGDQSAPFNAGNPSSWGNSVAQAPGFTSGHEGPTNVPFYGVLGKAKEFPFLNCTSFTYADDAKSGEYPPGFYVAHVPYNGEQDVPYLNVVVGAIIVPPSRLHELFYRMVVEWTVEFTAIRPISEIANFTGLGYAGISSHYQNYSYSSAKAAITGSEDSILDSDSCMVSANVDVEKVM